MHTIEKHYLRLYVATLSCLFACSSSLKAQASSHIERDRILSLAAMAYVYQDWQNSAEDERGYNIGAILYSPSGDSIVAWSRNSIRKAEIGKTAHAEIELMQHAIRDKKVRNLNGLHIITTLEPCMMCSGMMTFLEADSVKYIQTDPEYGKNIERLAADYNGQPGNERSKSIKSVHATSADYGTAIEELYDAFRVDPANKDKSMAEFLYSPAVKAIYKQANDELKRMKVKYPHNQKLLNLVKKHLYK